MIQTPDYELDFDRSDRVGVAEAVYCESKSSEQIRGILDAAGARGRSLLLTRLSADKVAALEAAGRLFDYDAVSGSAVFGVWPQIENAARSDICIVCGGTSDLPAALEAERTLRFHGLRADRVTDVGVAGLHRLLGRLDQLRTYRIIIAAAGMEAALPSVIAGLLPSVIIALPTSVGYGVAAGGRTALAACLASCAPGITVVNIDNGFGAAAAAIRIMRAMAMSAAARG